MIQQPMWQALDGKLFHSQQEMLTYEGTLLFTPVIDDYLAHAGVGAGMGERAALAAQTRVRNILSAALPYLDAKGLLSQTAKQAPAEKAAA
jgi:hypothetical protein